MVIETVVRHLLKETANLQDPRLVVFAVQQLLREDHFLARFLATADKEEGSATLRAFYAVKMAQLMH